LKLQYPSHPYFSKTVHQGVKVSELFGVINQDSQFFDDYHNVVAATGVYPKVASVSVCHSATSVVGI